MLEPYAPSNPGFGGVKPQGNDPEIARKLGNSPETNARVMRKSLMN